MQLDLNEPKQAHVDERLRQELIAWFTSVRPDGRPHSVPVWFVWDGTTVTLFSKPKNQKLVNISQNANVVLALDNTNVGGDPIAFEGTAALVQDTGLDHAQAYLDKYSALVQQYGWTPESMAADYSQAIRITLTRRLG